MDTLEKDFGKPTAKGKAAKESAQVLVEKDLAKQSAANVAKGGKNVKISLTETQDVEIIKDGRFLKKGTILRNVSAKAVLIYRKKGLIK